MASAILNRILPFATISDGMIAAVCPMILALVILP